MLRETRSNRIRDTRKEVDRWLVERIKAEEGRETMRITPPIALSETEVAELLGCSQDAVRENMRHRVPGTKIGKCWRYQVRDIVSWMVQKEMEAESHGT